MKTKKEFYLSKELAEVLRIDERAITRYIRAGKIKAVKVGNYWRIPAEEYNRIIKNGTEAGN